MVSSEWWKQFMIQNVHWILCHLMERTKPCDSIIRPSVNYMMKQPTVIKFWEVLIFIHLNLAIGRIFLRRNLTGTGPWRKGDHFSFYRLRDTLGRRDGKIEHNSLKENGIFGEWPMLRLRMASAWWSASHTRTWGRKRGLGQICMLLLYPVMEFLAWTS